MACYDLPRAKQLKLYELECTECMSERALLHEKVGLLELQAGSLRLAAGKLQEAVDARKDINESDAKMIRTLEQEVADEYEWSVRGGATYWVLGGGTLLFLLGGYAGWTLAR